MTRKLAKSGPRLILIAGLIILPALASKAQVVTYNRAAGRSPDFFMRPSALSIRSDLAEANHGLDVRANFSRKLEDWTLGAGAGTGMTADFMANTNWAQIGGGYDFAKGYSINAELRSECALDGSKSIPIRTLSYEEGIFVTSPCATAYAVSKQSSDEKRNAFEYLIELRPTTFLALNIRYVDMLHASDVFYLGFGSYPYIFSDGTRLVLEADAQLKPTLVKPGFWQTVRLGVSAYLKNGYKALITLTKPGSADQKVELRADIPI